MTQEVWSFEFQAGVKTGKQMDPEMIREVRSFLDMDQRS